MSALGVAHGASRETKPFTAKKYDMRTINTNFNRLSNNTGDFRCFFKPEQRDAPSVGFGAVSVSSHYSDNIKRKCGPD